MASGASNREEEAKSRACKLRGSTQAQQTTQQEQATYYYHVMHTKMPAAKNLPAATGPHLPVIFWGEREGALVLLRFLFITAVPNTKLCAWGGEDIGGHVL